MFIGLEGVDGAGKTTLAEKLADEIERQRPDDKVEIIHRSQLTRPPMAEYEHDIEDYRPGSDRHVIADRWHWGELVYGPLYRDKSALTVPMFRHIELFCLSRGIRFWHVTHKIQVIEDRLRSRGEDYLQSHHVEHVWDQFYKVADMAACTAGICMPPGDDDNDFVSEIVRNAEFYAEDAQNLNQFPSYVGRRTPAILLVGEKRGGKPPYPTETAFLPVGANSGAFLLDSLPDPTWKRMGICNALEENIPALYEILGGPMVVALGRAASDRLLELDIEHAAVPHPQYVRRFHSKRKAEYGELIGRVAETGDVKLSWPS